MRRFDTRALFRAMDARRRSRALTSTAVARETGVSVATLRRTASGGRLEVDGMLAMVDWVDARVEDFVRDTREGR